MKNFVLFLAGAFAVFSFYSCSSDDDSVVSARVVDFEARDTTIAVGEGSVLQLDFTFDAEAVFDDGQNVVVTISLPPELGLREGTAEIEERTGDDPIGARVTTCQDGSSFLVFDMDDNDLDQASNPSGDADARLKLTVDALSSGVALIEARAGASASNFCNQTFPGEAAVVINIL